MLLVGRASLNKLKAEPEGKPPPGRPTASGTGAALSPRSNIKQLWSASSWIRGLLWILQICSYFVGQILVFAAQQADGAHLEGLFFVLMVHRVKLTWLCKWTEMLE